MDNLDKEAAECSGTKTTMMVAFIAFWLFFIIHLVAHSIAYNLKNHFDFYNLAMLQKCHYVVVTVNCVIDVYILAATKYKCLSKNWWITMVLINLWLTVIWWILSTGILIKWGCPTEEKLREQFVLA
jgi:hypothetical protein